MLQARAHVAFRESGRFQRNWPGHAGRPGAFRHVELVLPGGDWLGVGSSHGRVRLRQRNIDAIAQYTQFASVALEPEQVGRLREFARSHEGEPFSWSLAAWNWAVGRIPLCRFLVAGPGRLWYCTRLVVEALRCAGVRTVGLNALVSTPEDVRSWCGSMGILGQYGDVPDDIYASSCALSMLAPRDATWQL